MDKQPVVMTEFDKLMEEERKIMMKSIERIFNESLERVRNSLSSLESRVTKLEVKDKIDISSHKSFGMLAECANANVIVDGTVCAKPCAAISAVVSKDQAVTPETLNSSSENFATITGLSLPPTISTNETYSNSNNDDNYLSLEERTRENFKNVRAEMAQLKTDIFTMNVEIYPKFHNIEHIFMVPMEELDDEWWTIPEERRDDNNSFNIINNNNNLNSTILLPNVLLELNSSSFNDDYILSSEDFYSVDSICNSTISDISSSSLLDYLNYSLNTLFGLGDSNVAVKDLMIITLEYLSYEPFSNFHDSFLLNDYKVKMSFSIYNIDQYIILIWDPGIFYFLCGLIMIMFNSL